MVQLTKNSNSEPRADKMAAVKRELENPPEEEEEEHRHFDKRVKQNFAMGGPAEPASQYNPLDEPSPLGLRLRKSPSLLELIQMKLSQPSTSKFGTHTHGKKQPTGAVASGEKLKASNFPASVLKIGTWEYKSRNEGDLVAKCYFAKNKLVWEVLDGVLKNKIEIQWSDIMGLKANYPDDGPGTIDVVLARQPLFFRETNPQPRKHTLWQATSDFTGGQASIHKRHFLKCPPGLLGKHFEKLIQCDPRLDFLSQQGEITLESLYFDTGVPVFDDQNEDDSELDLNREGSPSFPSLKEATSASGAQSSSTKNDDDAFGSDTPSPCSVEDINNVGIEHLKALGDWEQIKVPGLRSSMSMTDLVSHLENRISEQGSSNTPTLSNEEWESLQILEDINRTLFSDIQCTPDSDERKLMRRVDSLCRLLQKDNGAGEIHDSIEPELTKNQSTSMARKDSVGDLLLNLPRIASLPQFLFNVTEDYENQAR